MSSHPAWDPIRLPDSDLRIADVPLSVRGYWPWVAFTAGVAIITIGGVVFSR